MDDIRIDLGNEKIVEILQEAYQLFGIYGFKRVSMADIAKAAGVSRATLYNYFGNKKVIIRGIFDLLNQRADFVLEELNKDKYSFNEKIQMILNFKLQAMQEMGDMFIQDILETEDCMSHLELIRNEFRKGFLEFLEKEQRIGNITSKYEPEFIHKLLLSLEYQLKDEAIQEFYPNLGELAIALIDITLRGICINTK